jgi:deoxyribonuclease V
MTIIQELLRDDYTVKQAKSLQLKYNNLNSHIPKRDYINDPRSIETIVGVDISYFKKDTHEYGIACAVLWNYKQKKLGNHYFAKDYINFPYKPGFLGFRECKLLAKAISKFSSKPDLIMCDSHGKIHPRRFGEAIHLGYALNIPSIGIAKNYFIGYLDAKNFEKVKGKKVTIWAKDPKKLSAKHSNELLGYLICLNNSFKPVYLSIGYKINLGVASEICLNTTNRSRQPEPLYVADLLSRKEIKKYI